MVRTSQLVLATLRRHGLEPLATLHHFTHPQWFEDIGAFEKEKNIAHFLTYTGTCFK